MRVGTDEAESRALWDDVNLRSNRARLTGYNRLAAKAGTATVYAVASNADQVVDTAKVPDPKGDPLLVGHQIGDGDRGRVLAFAGFDSYLWERLGQPATRQGVELHHRFRRQLVLWLAHQEEDEGQVYARPDFRRLAVGAKQSV